MLSLHTTFSTVTLLYIITGVSCEELTPVKKQESSLEDSTVTLSYTYYKQATTEYFFWYRQYPGKPPEFLISHSGTGTLLSNPVSRLSATVSEDKSRMDLQISSAAVTDSALYYCAVRPYTGTQKITFGSGTRLTIEPKEEYEPSYYKVGNDSNTACLATGFSRHNASIFSLFNTTNATLISGDKLYNQVALLSDWDKEECEKLEKPEEKCEDTIEPDPMVNLMALTIMGLRLLFLKTIVFNVLMTFRLWISQ